MKQIIYYLSQRDIKACPYYQNVFSLYTNSNKTIDKIIIRHQYDRKHSTLYEIT